MKIKYAGVSIGSVAALAKTLGVEEQLLLKLSNNPTLFYTISHIPKKNGGERVISDPFKELKILQRRIVRRIFANCNFPNYLFGSVKDEANPRDFVRNALVHSTAKEVVAFDIDSFFPSIRPNYVKEVYKYLFKFPDIVADVLVKLTTLNNGLPQGAPTSSYIANLIFYDCEYKLVQVLSSKKLTYTRLVDDISISSVTHIDGATRTFIYGRVQALLSEKKLRISKRKYKITNTGLSGEKTIVTGLLVEDNKVKLPKPKVKAIGGLVYSLQKQAVVDRTDPDYHASFGKASGQVALYSRLDHSKAASYRAALRPIMPIFAPQKVKKIGWLCRNFIAYAKAHPEKLETEEFARKFYKYKHKLCIVRRTHRKLADNLRSHMDPYRPKKLLASYYE